MPPQLLKWLRISVAAAVFAALTAALVDFRELVPWQIGHTLAEFQFVPSLVALVTGASLSLACLIVALVTLMAGRIYCSAICPLGILQDVIHRLSKWLKRRPRPAPYSRPHTWLRQTFLWGTVAAALAGAGGFALSMLDPYSIFGRIVSDIFRPFMTLANNAVAGVTDPLGWNGLFHVEPHWAGLGALAVPVFVLLLVMALAAWRGRLYCNTICPVGTLLGWLSQRAAFRLQLDQNACRKCARCLHACKAQCIDLRSGTIDFSRCVACYDCMDACDEHGINYRFAWALKNTVSVPPPPMTSEFVTNPQRRAFLSRAVVGILGAAGVGGVLAAGDGRRDRHREQGHEAADTGQHSPVICPPGSSGIGQFLDRCTACHLCISECPTGVLQPAFLEYGLPGLMKPRMDFRVAFCNYDCRRCSEVCPDGAMELPDVAVKHLTKIGEAQFDRDKCVVVTNGTDCAACSEHCPTKAVSTIPFDKNGKSLHLPSVNNDFCIGCGACEYACPAKPDKAIRVTGLRHHGWAKKNIEPKATLPISNGDFPF